MATPVDEEPYLDVVRKHKEPICTYQYRLGKKKKNFLIKNIKRCPKK
jgi:hypothetical protein